MDVPENVQLDSVELLSPKALADRGRPETRRERERERESFIRNNVHGA